jgi:thioredoxin reductase
VSASESVVWLASAAVVAAVFVPYLAAFRRRRRKDHARKEEAVRLGIDRPVAQFPYIDAKRCIGCGVCVDACPESDVLGVVRGTATVVNALKCVGHARCEEACPVGAIEVGLGDMKSRDDVPLTDEWHETSVPGLYVAGELGGLALVRNAVAQGRRVVERIAQRTPSLRKHGGGEVLDAVIVGAGPAGTAAAAAAHERGLSYVVLEQEADLGGTVLHYPRRKLVLVQAVDIPLWGRLKEAEYSKEQVLAMLKDLTGRFGLNVRFGERVVGVGRADGLLSVRTERTTYLSRSVILALGRRGTPRKLGVPGEERAKVMYKLVDAESYRGQRILVVGGGDSAVEAVIGLSRQRGNTVTLSYRRDKLVRIKQKNEERIGELFNKGQVRPLFGSEVKEVLEDRVRLQVGGEAVELGNDFVFVFAGGEPPFALLRQIGVGFGGAARPPAPAVAQASRSRYA